MSRKCWKDIARGEDCASWFPSTHSTDSCSARDLSVQLLLPTQLSRCPAPALHGSCNIQHSATWPRAFPPGQFCGGMPAVRSFCSMNKFSQNPMGPISKGKFHIVDAHQVPEGDFLAGSRFPPLSNTRTSLRFSVGLLHPLTQSHALPKVWISAPGCAYLGMYLSRGGSVCSLYLQFLSSLELPLLRTSLITPIPCYS